MQIFISSSVISVLFKFVVLLGLRILFKHIIELLLNHFFFQCLYLWKKRVCFQHTSFYFLMEEERLTHPILSACLFHLVTQEATVTLVSLLLLYLSVKPFILYFSALRIPDFIFCLYFLDRFHVFFKSNRLFLQG